MYNGKEEEYKILAAIDEAMKTIKLQAAALKNADDIDANGVTLLKLNDAIKDMQNLGMEDQNLQMSSYEDEEDNDEDNTEYSNGMAFFN